MNKNESVLDWVLIAKGIGILLVVIGHFYPHDAPGYWREIRKIIYTFHMPLFFLLSGFLYTYAKYSYSTLIKIKTRRLLYPFVSIAIIFFIIKYISGILFNLEHPVGIERVYALLVNPVNSYMPLLWFVYALFLIFLIYPLLRNIINNNLVILIIFVFINVFWGNDYPVIGPALANIPYFIIGVILRENRGTRDKIIYRGWIHAGVSLMMFVLMSIVGFGMGGESQSGYILRLMLGVSGSICVMNVSFLIDAKRKTGVERVLLAEIGFYSMTIYLFHTLFESAVRIGFYQIVVDFYFNFEVVALTAVAAGVVFPLLLEKMILRKNGFTKKYILGLTGCNVTSQ